MKDPFKGTPFWRPSEEERAALLGHLRAELPVGHVIWTNNTGLTVEGRDREGDRIAVTTTSAAVPAAIVHMSWEGRPAMAPFLPETEVFPSLDALLQSLKEVSDA